MVIALRDQFAMAALTGMLASPYASSRQGVLMHKGLGSRNSQDFFSSAAYTLSDAMMEARKAEIKTETLRCNPVSCIIFHQSYSLTALR